MAADALRDALQLVIADRVHWYEISSDSRTKWCMIMLPEYADMWDYGGLSHNPNVTIQHVRAFPDKPWNWDVLSRRFVAATVARYPYLPWNWSIVTKYTTWRIIDRHWGLPWAYAEFSRSRRMSRQILINNMSLPWDFDFLSGRGLVSIRVLEMPGCRSLPWNWYKLTRNPGISVANMLSHASYPWDWVYLVQSCKFSVYEVFKNPHVPWNYDWFEKTEVSALYTREQFYAKLNSLCLL
jgi:hypothetical protein